MRHAEIIFGVTSGQTFFYDPPEQFRPTGTPTVAVYDGAGDDTATAESATTGAASVDSVNTTLDADADVGTRTLTVDSATGITRGRRYLLGGIEWVEVHAISGVTITTRHPIINDHASGSTFEGCRISIAVNATWVADASNLSDAYTTDVRYVGDDQEREPGAAGYRLRWSYTVNSVPTIGVSYADLVRYQSKNLVTALDVDRTFPGWIDHLATDYRDDQGAALVDEAFTAVKMDALADAQLLRRIRDTQVLSELVKYRANVLAVQNDVIRGNRDPQALEVANRLYEQRYNQLLREPKIPVDHSGGGAASEAVRLPPWRR